MYANLLKYVAFGILATLMISTLFYGFWLKASAQIVPAQNQVIPSAYFGDGYLISTSTSGTHKLGALPVDLAGAFITGILNVLNGGTGSTTLSGILKGNGTSPIQTAVPNTDYQVPVSLTTTGTSGVATFNGTTLNIPNYTSSGGSGNVGTSSAETATYVPFWTSTAGTPATLSGGESTFAYDASLNKLTVANASTTNSSITTAFIDALGKVLDGGGFNIANLADPVNPQDAATMQYVIDSVTGLLDYRGGYDASTNLFPATGGSGLLGAVLKGDFWIVTTPGTLGGTAVTNGDLVIAIVDTPGQTASNWDIIANDVGYAPLESVVGTVNRITVDNTDPINPVVDISGSYVGQSSITTVGTIGTGVWNGTTIGVGFGGTGQSSLTSSQLLYGNGTNALSSVATTSVTCAGSASCTPFTAIGAAPITITGTDTVNSKWATSTIPALGIYPNAAFSIGVGTTTPIGGGIVSASSTAPQLLLRDGGATSVGSGFRHNANTLYIASTTAAGATSTTPIATFDYATGSTTVLKLDKTGIATSTFAGGINLTSGCFAQSNVCIGSSPAFSPITKLATIFETQARFTNNSSGGSANINANGMVCTTTGTGGRNGGALVNLATNSAVAGSPRMSSTFWLSTIGTAGFFMVSVGEVGTDPTFSHFGFKVVYTAGPTATLYASQANGSSETVSSALTTIAASDTMEVLAVKNSTNSIDYYWQKNGGGWSSATNLTGTMPGASTAWLNVNVNNAATATTNTVTVTGFTYER